MNIKTSLQGRQPVTPWNDDDLRAKAKKLWHECGTLMIRPEWVNNDFDRQHVLNVGHKMFGRRLG